MDNIREVFSHNLKAHRGDRTQAQMAERLGVPYRTYVELERGNLPQDSTLTLIAEKLGVAPTSLYMDPELPHPSQAELEIERKKQELIRVILDADASTLRHFVELAEDIHFAKARARQPQKKKGAADQT